MAVSSQFSCDWICQKFTDCASGHLMTWGGRWMQLLTTLWWRTWAFWTMSINSQVAWVGLHILDSNQQSIRWTNFGIPFSIKVVANCRLLIVSFNFLIYINSQTTIYTTFCTFMPQTTLFIDGRRLLQIQKLKIGSSCTLLGVFLDIKIFVKKKIYP